MKEGHQLEADRPFCGIRGRIGALGGHMGSRVSNPGTAAPRRSSREPAAWHRGGGQGWTAVPLGACTVADAAVPSEGGARGSAQGPLSPRPPIQPLHDSHSTFLNGAGGTK